jgi:hypothetical protein
MARNGGREGARMGDGELLEWQADEGTNRYCYLKTMGVFAWQMLRDVLAVSCYGTREIGFATRWR